MKNKLSCLLMFMFLSSCEVPVEPLPDVVGHGDINLTLKTSWPRQQQGINLSLLFRGETTPNGYYFLVFSELAPPSTFVRDTAFYDVDIGGAVYNINNFVYDVTDSVTVRYANAFSINDSRFQIKWEKFFFGTPPKRKTRRRK